MEEKNKNIEENVDDAKGDSKLMWKTLKNILYQRPNETGYSELIYGDNIITDVDKIPDMFNTYFVDSIEKNVNSIPSSSMKTDDQATDVFGKWNDIKLLDYNELKDVMKSIPDKGSSNELHISIIKECYEDISDCLINVVNLSLEKRIMPNELEFSAIVPIQKKAGTKLIDEFKPINTLPTEAKIIERIVHNQLLNYIKDNKILIDNQSGFREVRSTETTVYYWQVEKQDKLTTAVLFLDWKRAFETVHRGRLSRKLKGFGIGATILRWFKNYF